MDEKQIKGNIEALEAEMIEKGFDRPEVTIMITMNHATAYCSWRGAGSTYRDKWETLSGKDVISALNAAQKWLGSKPSMEARKKAEARDMFIKSIDAAVAAGIDEEIVKQMKKQLEGMGE